MASYRGYQSVRLLTCRKLKSSPKHESSGRFHARPSLKARRLWTSGHVPTISIRLFSSGSVRWKENSKDSDNPSHTNVSTRNPSSSYDHNKSSTDSEEAHSQEHKPSKNPRNRVADHTPPRKIDGVSDSKSSIDTSSVDTVSGGSSSSRREGVSKKSSSENALSKPMVPDIYPRVMAIPIAKRPLFPGFYKAITIRNPAVAAAIQELMRRGQPYIGAFLFKDENADKDVIQSVDDVHEVGTFCQITSAFPVSNGDGHDLTAVLYPHRRIRMTSLAPQALKSHDALPIINRESSPKIGSESISHNSGDVVASFEEKDALKHDENKTSMHPTRDVSEALFASMVNVENLQDVSFDRKDQTIRALTSEIVNCFREIANLNSLFKDQITTFSVHQTIGNVMEEPGRLADFAAAVATGGEPDEMQEVLETLDIKERLSKSLHVLKKELVSAQLSSKISKDVEQKIQKRQRDYYLMEQFKAIKRELGLESDGKDKLVETFREKCDKLAMPDPVRKVFDEELAKLGSLEPAASEFNVTRNYLDWLTQIPWGQRSAENFGIHNAMGVLDEDHHGLKDVKDRILEFIAVGKLRGTVEGKILCFVGPPGVGKTSIGKSIARALNRQYYRFSVGGLTDVAEIKGHRRTYVGALPGRIIQALKKCQTENPLILIDEIDKIGRGIHGDPSSALLELLDPEQNGSFLDHYMDVPVDLSKVLFVCTANMTETIPRPLLDRMELIELSGYVADEKIAIAERFLAPQAKDASGLKDAGVNLDSSAIKELINRYCRESGVRNLKKHIDKVFRKSALKIIQDFGEGALTEDVASIREGKERETKEHTRAPPKVPDSVQITITRDNLRDYVGPPIYTSDRLYETTPPGVAMGLAWTSMGGAALYIESIIESALNHSSSPQLKTTGSLKEVMKESTSVAYSFAKSLVAKNYPQNSFFEKAKLHLHLPEGAVSKDGPSAGITIASSLLSLALDTPLESTIAMTGELTVTGKVLRIGGLREKVVAARRAGAKTVIFPKDNESDWLELPENIKNGIEGQPVSWYSDVFKVIFPVLDEQRANTLWKNQLSPV